MSSTKYLDSLTQAFLSRPLLIKSVYASSIVSISVMTGVAACLHTWVVPMLLQAHSTRTKLKQFRRIIDLGFRVLQPLSRVQGAALAWLAFVTSRSNNPVVNSQTKYFIAALCSVLTIAPYESFLIFPINDRLYEIMDELKQEGKEDSDGNPKAAEVDRLLGRWKFWHTGRVIIPLISSTVLAWGALSLLPS